MPYNQHEWNTFKKKIPSRPFYTSPYFLAFSGVILISSVVLLTNIADFRNEIKTTSLKPEVFNSEQQPSRKVLDSEEAEEIINEKTEITVVLEKVEKVGIEDDTHSSDEPDITGFAFKGLKEKPVKVSVPKPCAKFTIENDAGCAPLTIHCIPALQNDTVIYLWDFGNGDFSNEISPKYSYEAPGIYNLTLTVKYFHSEKIVTSMENIEVFEKPDIDFNWQKNGNTYIFKGEASGSVYIKWDFSPLGIITEVAQPIVTFNESGKYLVSYIAENDMACTDTVTKELDVVCIPVPHMPNAFTPNGDGTDDFFGPVGVGLENYSVTLNIYDGYGKLVYISNNPDQHWNGILMNGNIAPEAYYLYELIMKDKDGNRVFYEKKAFRLRRH